MLQRTLFDDGLALLSSYTDEQRAERGQFFTPQKIANFAASFFDYDFSLKQSIDVLDPGAGSGILTMAVLAELVGRGAKQINVSAFENDEKLFQVLSNNLEAEKNRLMETGVVLELNLSCKDFLKSYTLNQSPRLFDLIISNPPYFKLTKNERMPTGFEEIIHGQPNIYSFFMAAAAKALKPSGQLSFIVPRSFSSGAYFKEFRSFFFSEVSTTKIHTFRSRNQAFKEDQVLQENIILHARKISSRKQITISSSEGMSDLDLSRKLVAPYDEIIDANQNLYVPFDSASLKILNVLKTKYQNSLNDIGLRASTGQVVPFRNKEKLLHSQEGNCIPLLWLNHIERMRLKHPLEKFRKEQWLCAKDHSPKLVVTKSNYVVLRRFSPKEDLRRITAAPLLEEDFKGEYIALENHTNYIWGKDKKISEALAYGLSAYLNSSAVDTFLRCSNGNTQIGATDLNMIPVPTVKELELIGSAAKRKDPLTLFDWDFIVEQVMLGDGKL